MFVCFTFVGFFVPLTSFLSSYSPELSIGQIRFSRACQSQGVGGDGQLIVISDLGQVTLQIPNSALASRRRKLLLVTLEIGGCYLQ